MATTVPNKKADAKEKEAKVKAEKVKAEKVKAEKEKAEKKKAAKQKAANERRNLQLISNPLLGQADLFAPLLNLIGKTEGTDYNPLSKRGRGYNETVYYGALTKDEHNPTGEVDLTKMTLTEIYKLQRKMLKRQRPNEGTSALGRYQFIYSTLKPLAEKLGMDPDTVKFDKETQDKLAIARLIDERELLKAVSGEITIPEFQNQLAKEWASLPKTDGKGNYRGQNAHAKGVEVDAAAKAVIENIRESRNSNPVPSKEANGNSSATSVEKTPVASAPAGSGDASRVYSSMGFPFGGKEDIAYRALHGRSAPQGSQAGIRSVSGKITMAPGADKNLPGGKKPPRGMRNNNPGNIIYGPFAKRHGATGSDGHFAIFPTMAAGQAAQQALLRIYLSSGANTIRKAISRWAPASENKTEPYINDVSKQMGVDPDQVLSSAQIPALADAISRHKNGAKFWNAMGAANMSSRAFAGAGNGNGGGNSTSTTGVTVGQIVVHTQATDAPGIANSIGGAVSKYGFVSQANRGLE